MVESLNNSIPMEINEMKQEIQQFKKLVDEMSEMKSQMNHIINYLFDGQRIQGFSSKNIIGMKNVMENLKRKKAESD